MKDAERVQVAFAHEADQGVVPEPPDHRQRCGRMRRSHDDPVPGLHPQILNRIRRLVHRLHPPASFPELTPKDRKLGDSPTIRHIQDQEVDHGTDDLHRLRTRSL